MLSFPKGGGRGALKEKQTNIDSPQSQLELKWDEKSPSLNSYPGQAATAEGSCLDFEHQHNKVLLVCWEGRPLTGATHPCLWPWCLSRQAQPARGSPCPAHSRLCTTTTHVSKHQRTRTRTVGGRTVSFELRWWMAAHSYLAQGDPRTA